MVTEIKLDEKDDYRPLCTVNMTFRVAPEIVYEYAAVKASSFLEGPTMPAEYALK